MGFQGYVVSDCAAVRDISLNHKYASTMGEGAVEPSKRVRTSLAEMSIEPWSTRSKPGISRKPKLDRSLERLFVARFRLGMFDPPSECHIQNSHI